MDAAHPQLLRPGLLIGLDVVIAGAASGDDGGDSPIASVLSSLGADVRRLDADLLDEAAVTAAAQAIERATVLVCDGGAAMRAARGHGAPAPALVAGDPGALAPAPVAGDPGVPSSGSAERLRAAVEGSWTVTRAIVNAHLAPAGFGKVILVAPRPADGPDAAVAGAALENLARTTAVEWARLGIRVVAVRPRDITSDDALAHCIAYLASPAGDYFSGCVLDLGTAGLTAVPPAAG